MDTKLTLKLDQAAIAGAKHYAARRGVSLSRLVEGYFLRLAAAALPANEKATGVVAELAGVLKGVEFGDPKAEYAEYLAGKYS